jgi:hypothetical protein
MIWFQFRQRIDGCAEEALKDLFPRESLNLSYSPASMWKKNPETMMQPSMLSNIFIRFSFFAYTIL